MLRFAPSIAVLSLVLGVSAAQAATPTHLYLLNGSLSDALGGPSLVSAGGTLGASDYSFDANQGLSLSNGLNVDNYTIDFSFSFGSLDSYRKLVDFKDRSADAGLYNLTGALNFYPVTTGPAAFSPDTWARVTLTRDAGGLVSGYVNGVLQISFNDTSSLATFGAADNIAQFFKDDFATAGGEASGGRVDYIAIYDHALSADEVSKLTPAIPEPQTYALLGLGLACIGWISRKQRR